MQGPLPVFRSDKTFLAPSGIAGKGLFARHRITAGELVAIKGGDIVHISSTDSVPDAPIFGLLQLDDFFLIGAPHRKDKENANTFLNHSCRPNVGINGNILFVAMREILEGEELTYDRCMSDNQAYEMPCLCGAPDCRNIVRGQDWTSASLQHRYRGFFSSYIQRKIAQTMP